jgi:MAF protein
MKLLLASSSPYRRQLLQQLQLPFDYLAPDIDESPLIDESPRAYVKRLAQAKATALVDSHPRHWIIGSDQTCVVNGEIVGKPGNRERAIAQLQACSGQCVDFYTGLALYRPEDGRCFSLVEPFTVHFRSLSHEEIEHYVDLEQPFDCAGSFKVEGLGIHLFENLEGRDYNSLIGLPLIALCNLMRQAGLSPLLQAQAKA